MSVSNKIFDTNVQLVKYKVLKEVIRHAFAGDLASSQIAIAKEIADGNKESMQCCIYKERAISEERVLMAMGGDRSNPNPIAVINIACDECPIDGMLVTSACRGCLMHACKDVCPRDAISIVDKHAVIDRSKCIECGKCSQVCPYEAIITRHRPCIKSCKVKAISMDEERKAKIDYDKCIACGACVYRCPFGAITDKSFVTDIIDMLKKSDGGKKYRVYAVIAPAIVSQFHFGRVTQVVTAIKKIGFHQVVEAALGADITLYHEVNEWKEKRMLTTSCCPSFVAFLEKNFPELSMKAWKATGEALGISSNSTTLSSGMPLQSWTGSMVMMPRSLCLQSTVGIAQRGRK